MRKNQRAPYLLALAPRLVGHLVRRGENGSKVAIEFNSKSDRKGYNWNEQD